MAAHSPIPPGTDLSRFEWYRYQGRPDGSIFYYAYDEASRTLYCESAVEGLFKQHYDASSWHHLLTYRGHDSTSDRPAERGAPDGGGTVNASDRR